MLTRDYINKLISQYRSPAMHPYSLWYRGTDRKYDIVQTSPANATWLVLMDRNSTQMQPAFVSGMQTVTVCNRQQCMTTDWEERGWKGWGHFNHLCRQTARSRAWCIFAASDNQYGFFLPWYNPQCWQPTQFKKQVTMCCSLVKQKRL